MRNGVASFWAALGRGVTSAFGLLVAGLLLSGCETLQEYRAQVPPEGAPIPCSAPQAAATEAVDCQAQSTEPGAGYALHVVEFDDEGWPFDSARADNQIDSAIRQIKAQLATTTDCVRLYVYVHGWRHNAAFGDSNVASFRGFLREVASRSARSTGVGTDACDDPALALATAEQKKMRPPGARAPANRAPRVQTVGLYVGWRGASIVNVRPWVYASFWDRKNTADRVSQGSVRELFGRLSALARYAPSSDKPQPKEGAKTQAQLRTYVIGHSFGASVVFRALSQSLIDSFSEDLDVVDESGLASVSRFVDMVVLVNPAIEAARFDPVFRAAQKRASTCRTRNAERPEALALCEQPPYQAPVLAIFQSDGDLATRSAFPVGAALSNVFERTVDAVQRESIVNTVGWYERFQTHRLDLATACNPAEASPFVSIDGALRFRPPGWQWCFQTGAATMGLHHLGPTQATQATPWREPADWRVYNGPLWNVRVSGAIVADHSDTWNALFTGLLLHLFTDERANRLP